MISDIAIVRFYRLFGKAKNIGYRIFSECTDRYAIHRFCVNSVMPYKTAENFSRRPVFAETSLKNGVCQKIGARFRYVPKRIRFLSSFLSVFCFCGLKSQKAFSPRKVNPEQTACHEMFDRSHNICGFRMQKNHREIVSRRFF